MSVHHVYLHRLFGARERALAVRALVRALGMGSGLKRGGGIGRL